MSKGFDTVRQKERDVLEQTFATAVERLTSPELTRAFLTELLTEKERLTIARRLLIASMIQRGETYMAVNELLQVSPNTFTKIKQWLDESLPDYHTAIQQTEGAARQRRHKRSRSQKEYDAPFSFAHIKKRYPGHFLLLDLANDLVLKKLKG